MIKKVSESYKHHLPSIIFGPFLKIIEAFFDLLIPLFMKAIIDLNQYGSIDSIPNKISSSLGAFIRIFNPSETPMNDALAGGLIILVMGIIGYAITMVSQYLAARSSVDIGTEVRRALFSKMVQLSKKEREEIGSAKLSTLINSDTYQLQHGILLLVRLAVRAPFILIGSLIISFILDWRIGIAFTVIAPMIMLVNYFILKKSSKGYMEIQSDLDVISKQWRKVIDCL